MKAAVIGHLGVTGASCARMIGKEYDLVTFDVAERRLYPRDEVAGCDFAVICVGTPSLPDGSADLEQVSNAVWSLPERLPALIRSTVPPGTTDAVAADRDGLVCHAPEFMQERAGGPWPESADVPFMILGGSRAARAFFRACLEPVFPGAIRECDALTAELAKYAANLHWAARVTFVTEMAAVTAALGADWEQVRAAWLADARVGADYTAMNGFAPGFGGRCWPKDLDALIAAAAGAGYDARFLAAVRDANQRFREES